MRRQSRATVRTAINVEAGVTKRMKLNSQCINYIRISGNHRAGGAPCENARGLLGAAVGASGQNMNRSVYCISRPRLVVACCVDLPNKALPGVRIGFAHINELVRL